MSGDPKTLYERLGGEPTLEAAVAVFYAKIAADPELAPFFAGMDMATLAKKQIAFMSHAFGGPQKYSGRKLAEAHSDSVANGLTDRHFDATAEHLRATLVELDVAPHLVAEVLGVVGSTRSAVLGRER